MSRLDPAKSKEANDELKLAEKALAKTLLKWKPDYVEAEPHFQRAARAFKAAGLMDSAISAWRSAADCLYKLGNLKAGAVVLESAAREVSAGKDDIAKTEAARLYAEASGFLQETGETVRAADLKLRASKLCEGFDQALALRFIDECISLFDGDKDKDVYAVDPLRKAMQAQLSLGKHASAMRTMDRLWVVWSRLDQKHNLYKLVLSRVILLLAAADPVAAQREYESRLDVSGFTATQEAHATEDLIQAYTDMDPDGLTELFKKHTIFGYLEPAITRTAKGLAAALSAGGSRVGVSKDDEAASEAVHFAEPEKNAFGEGFQVRQFGSGNALGGAKVSAAPAEGDEDYDPADAAAAARAAKREAKEANARAALFSGRGGGSGGGGGGRSAAALQPADDDDSAPIVPTRRADPKAASAPEEELDDEDAAAEVEAAFAAMSAGGDESGGTQGKHEAAAEALDEDGLM